MSDATAPLPRVANLNTTFRIEGGTMQAVNGISYEINRGEVAGIVGESGSVKSVGAGSPPRLIPSPPGTLAGDQVLFEGRDLLTVPEEQMRRVRGNEIAMIFQEPLASLNLVFTIGGQIAEPPRLHQGLTARAAREQAIEQLRGAGVSAPERRVDANPHHVWRVGRGSEL